MHYKADKIKTGQQVLSFSIGEIVELYIKAFRVLNNMFDRCSRENNHGYARYGGRGIYVDERWIKDPTSFINWYVENYFEGAQVDRIDNDGPYSPDNCRLVDAKTNGRNREITKRITAWGEEKTFMEWLEDPRCVVKSYTTLAKRIKDKWIPEEAISLRVDIASSMKRKERNNKGNIRGQASDVEKLTAFGESKTLHEWSIDPRCKVDKNTLWYRKSKGWDMEKAITTPPAKNAGQLYEGKSVLQWSKDPQCQVSYKVLNSRLKKGIPLATALKA